MPKRTIGQRLGHGCQIAIIVTASALSVAATTSIAAITIIILFAITFSRSQVETGRYQPEPKDEYAVAPKPSHQISQTLKLKVRHADVQNTAHALAIDIAQHGGHVTRLRAPFQSLPTTVRANVSRQYAQRLAVMVQHDEYINPHYIGWASDVAKPTVNPKLTGPPYVEIKVKVTPRLNLPPPVQKAVAILGTIATISVASLLLTGSTIAAATIAANAVRILVRR